MLIIVGSPGAGKTVQARLIEENANVKWLSTGQLLRDQQGAEQLASMNRGVLVSDTLVEDVLANAIQNVSNGTRILIDGFPRNEIQAHWLRGYMAASRRNLVAIIHLMVDEEVAVERMVSRGRSDDTEASIRERYQIYREQVVPMVELLQSFGFNLVEINGGREVDVVHADIMKALKGLI